MNQTEIPFSANPGFSFNEASEIWDQFIGDKLEPTSADELIYRNVQEVLRTPGVDISEKTTYLTYLQTVFRTYADEGILIPHKAWIQLEMAKLGINESETRIIPSSDFATALHYTMSLLEKGHTDVWWGTADIDDHSDPEGNQNISPPLYKHIRNFKDAVLNLACATEFAKDHPNSFLKVFPQDGPKPAIGSLVVAENKKGGKWLHLKIRKGEYTTSERQKGDDKPISISIDYQSRPPRIYTNQSTTETMRWLQIMLNSSDYFSRLDELQLIGSDYLNPEFLIFQNGSDTKINFFTDVIWGSKNKKNTSKKCPRISAVIMNLKFAIEQGRYLVLTNQNENILYSRNNFMFQTLSTIKSGRSKNPDTEISAKLLLKLIELQEPTTKIQEYFIELIRIDPTHLLSKYLIPLIFSTDLTYLIPNLSFRTIQQLKSLANGGFGNELEETIMDLEQNLRYLDWPKTPDTKAWG